MTAENRSEAARRRWEGLTPGQRRARTEAARSAYRINAAKRRIAKDKDQIAADRALIAELTDENRPRT